MKVEPFVKLPRDLIESDAWKVQSLTCRRLIDFLMLEHMAHGGKENGALVATRRQLEDFGLRRNSIAGAIREAERLGLAHCDHGGHRVASRFTLTWLPHHDGGPPSNRWREYRPSQKPQVPANKRPRRKAPETATKKAPETATITAFEGPRNGDHKREDQGPRNGDHSIEGLTTGVGSVSVSKEEVGWCGSPPSGGRRGGESEADVSAPGTVSRVASGVVT
jgi:hypothetical protein